MSDRGEDKVKRLSVNVWFKTNFQKKKHTSRFALCNIVINARFRKINMKYVLCLEFSVCCSLRSIFFKEHSATFAYGYTNRERQYGVTEISRFLVSLTLSYVDSCSNARPYHLLVRGLKLYQ